MYQKDYQRAYYQQNKERIKKRRRAHHPNPEIAARQVLRSREYNTFRQRKFVERRQAIVDKQNGICPCGEPLGIDLNLDHDHKCCDKTRARETCGKCDRAVMHRGCNQIIGLLREDPKRLRMLADYVESFGVRDG